MIRVEEYTGTDYDWDTFASSQRGYSHFHKLAWRGVVSRVFGHDCVYLAARDKLGELKGILPLVRVRSVMFGHYLVSMPFLNYGGPLGEESSVRALVTEAIDLARRDGVKLLELRSTIRLPVDLPVSHRKVTMLLDLPGSSNELFASFEAKLRSQIRRPQKAGATVSFGHGEVSSFYSVFSRHMRDLGTPTQSLEFFRAISEAFPDDSIFAAVYMAGKPVAAGCGFRFGDQFEMTWASSLREHSREAPNMLLYWGVMQRVIEQGARIFNFGRCTPGSGTHRFKTQWGAREEPLWWYNFAASAAMTTPSPDDPAYSWGPRIWRRLPTSIATAMGPSIVRFIP